MDAPYWLNKIMKAFSPPRIMGIVRGSVVFPALPVACGNDLLLACHHRPSQLIPASPRASPGALQRGEREVFSLEHCDVRRNLVVLEETEAGW
ncbi:hypothetical protein J4Q44_G00040290 [Coregonus suidteri]|uniref:Uncharacterized protein n=1 Tax=Coregonus suidteri TaxID=861788 RepID=A0AAN8MDR0_9TELE